MRQTDTTGQTGQTTDRWHRAVLFTNGRPRILLNICGRGLPSRFQRSTLVVRMRMFVVVIKATLLGRCSRLAAAPNGGVFERQVFLVESPV